MTAEAPIHFQVWTNGERLLLSHIWQNSSISFPFIPAALCWQWWALCRGSKQFHSEWTADENTITFTWNVNEPAHLELLENNCLIFHLLSRRPKYESHGCYYLLFVLWNWGHRMWEYFENSLISNCASAIKVCLIEITPIPGSSLFRQFVWLTRRSEMDCLSIISLIVRKTNTTMKQFRHKNFLDDSHLNVL